MLAVTSCAAGRVDALCGQPYRLMDLPVMSELQDTLRNMGFVQLLLAFVFLTGYALALSSLTGALGRKRAGIVALLAALAFVATTQPWVHGVLLMVFAVAGLGLFSPGTVARRSLESATGRHSSEASAISTR